MQKIKLNQNLYICYKRNSINKIPKTKINSFVELFMIININNFYIDIKS